MFYLESSLSERENVRCRFPVCLLFCCPVAHPYPRPGYRANFTNRDRCGAVYLCWLGIQLILKPRRHLVHQDRAAAPASNWFVKGMMGNVLNPKMGIFYVSFLPQFIPAGHSPIAWTFLLVAIHVAIGTIWSLTLIVTSRSAARLLKTPLFIRWMDRATGGLFVLFAARLAFSHR